MKYLLSIICSCLIISTASLAQDGMTKISADTGKSINYRRVFLYSGVGTFDNVSGGIGYQFNEKYSVSLKVSSTVSPPDFLVMGSSVGIGPRFSIHYANDAINLISFEALPYVSMSNAIYKNNGFLKGSYFSCSFGHENITEKGLCFYYNAGVGLTSSTEGSEFRVLLRFGVNFNYFDGFK